MPKRKIEDSHIRWKDSIGHKPLSIFFQKWHISLHAYTSLPFSLDGYRVSFSFKPTRCLHDAYTSLHDFEALQRADENLLAHLQVFCFLQAKKFSREFCGIQVE